MIYVDADIESKGGAFGKWVRELLVAKGWRVADLARQIARNEGRSYADGDDLQRRTKAIHGHVSNMLNGESGWGSEYILKVSEALGADQAEALRVAGKLRDAGAGKGKDRSTRVKLETLIELLDEDEQQEAIRYLTLFVQAKQQQKRERTGKHGSKKPKPAN